MAENKNHSLVVRPPGAVEKAAPGAKRILSGMVAETLALVKKESPVKPIVSVLVVGGVVDSHAELFEAAFRAFLSDQYDLRIVAADNAVEVLRLAQQRPFDLFIAILNNVWQGLNEIRLDPPDGGTWGDRISFLTRLKKQFGKPIIAMSGLAEMGFEERARRAGADAFFLLPFEMENLLAAVQSCLKIQSKSLLSPAKRARSESSWWTMTMIC